MTFGEALQILGIDATVGKKGARRAYLKLIKVHKPDRDPEMFRRVREAYERVKDEIEYYAPRPSTPPPQPAPPPRTDVVVVEPVEARSDPPKIEARVSDPPRIEERAPEPPRIEARAAEPPRIEEHVPDPVRVETHAERPLRIEVRSDPVEEAPPPPSQDARPLRFDHERRANTPSPAELLAAAWAIFDASERGKGIDALALQAFAAAHVDPEAPQPSAHDAIHLCLGLFGAGRIIMARRVSRAMVRWLSETGLERDVMGGSLAAMLAVLHAFLGLPPDTPAAPITIIAMATRARELQDAVPLLRRFVRDSPFSALVTADIFRDHAPLLHGMYDELLRSGEVQLDLMQIEEAPPPAKRKGCAGVLFFVLLCLGIGVIAEMCEDGAPMRSNYTPPKIEVPAFEPPSIPKLDLSKVRDLTRELEQTEPLWLRLLCPEGAEAATEKCAHGEGVYEALQSGRCAAARTAAERLAGLAEDDSTVRMVLIRVQQAVQQCRPAPSEK